MYTVDLCLQYQYYLSIICISLIPWPIPWSWLISLLDRYHSLIYPTRSSQIIYIQFWSLKWNSKGQRCSMNIRWWNKILSSFFGVLVRSIHWCNKAQLISCYSQVYLWLGRPHRMKTPLCDKKSWKVPQAFWPLTIFSSHFCFRMEEPPFLLY